MPRPMLLVLLCLLAACATEPAAPPADPGSRPGQALDTEGTPVTAATDTSEVSAETAAAFDRVMERARAEDWHARPYGEIVQAVGAELLGAEYKEGLLDVSPEETLVVDLAAFDCVLYVENVLALARGIAQQDYDFGTYVGHLESFRYREGTLDGYCSRLHYFTDWIYDNDRRGQVDDVTQDVGGVPFEKTLDFMTEHRDAYAKLVDDSTFACIAGVEATMRERDLYYVPEDRIRAAYAQLQPGDLIATATDIDGLDVTHTGFVYKTPEGGTGFIHASLSGEVKVSDDLASYIEGNARQIGIIVARPVSPG